MSTTLSYGFKLPQDGDTGGNDFWDDLEHDIQQLNDHDHDGTDSALLTTASVNAVQQSVDTTTHGADTTQGWVLQASGEYKRTITISNSAIQFNKTHIQFLKFTGTSGSESLYDQIFPTIEKTAISTFNAYVNDISTAFVVVYS